MATKHTNMIGRVQFKSNEIETTYYIFWAEVNK